MDSDNSVRTGNEAAEKAGPLKGIKVIDAATLIAGPLCATVLADYGADVIKVEHPTGDPVRGHGFVKDNISIYWKYYNRNKQTVTLNLSKPEGQEIMLKLLADADVLIENFRPGTLERWNLGWDRLHALNPKLVLLRTTAFGQFGPYSSRPGFGTIAESMSGWVSLNGDPNGPPMLPPFGLGDSIAALAGSSATMMALFHRDARGGQGQLIDLAIMEPILTVVGPHISIYDRYGIVPHRLGNRSAINSPRNIYKTSDGHWVAMSTSAQSVAERVMRLVGHPEVIDEPWFVSGSERVKHADELDAMVGGWIAARPLDEVARSFEEAEAALTLVYEVPDVMNDPQYQALGSLPSIPDPDFGSMRMQNVMFRMSDTPGKIRWTGRNKGQDNAAVYGSLGIGPERLAELKSKGVL